ncbi:MAG TPA: hypothetical protein VE777_20545 [Gaiellales bacterium]|jgi:hypothetical protein|nr:hypothetical protein [Gaiellales bacterium]
MRDPDAEYHSGDDYTVEFLDYRYGFSRTDFGQRVAAAAVRLELVEARDLAAEEVDDLVAVAADGRVAEPASALGAYLAENAAELDGLHAEPLAYWLRKLVFRGAWLDHRLKAGMLDVSFDESSGAFAYRMPTDQAPVVDVAPVPSWAPLRFTE